MEGGDEFGQPHGIAYPHPASLGIIEDHAEAVGQSEQGGDRSDLESLQVLPEGTPIRGIGMSSWIISA